MSPNQLRWESPIVGNGVSGDYKPGIEQAEGYVAVRGHCLHKSFPMDAVATKGLEAIDGHQWELFSVECFNNTTIWGGMVEGLGCFHVMVPREHVRDLTENEREYFGGKSLALYGSHSGKISRVSQMPTLVETHLSL